MVRRLLATLTATVMAVLLLAPPASAGEPPANQTAYRTTWYVCYSHDGYIDIGGQVFMKEIGDTKTNQFRVKWLLYTQANPTSTTTAYRRWTVESNAFASDGRNFSWTSPKHRWNDLVVPDNGFTLVAKLTWVRPGHRDWNHRLLIARCS